MVNATARFFARLTIVLAAAWLAPKASAREAPPASAEDAAISPDVVEKASRAVAFIETPGGIGSGFFISRDGFLMTSAHVLSGAEKAEIETRDGKRYPVEYVAAFSLKQDLMLLKVAGQFEYLELEDPRKIKLGQAIFCIGHPYGHKWTLSKGYIAGKREEEGRPIIQISSDISPGNSGGPILTPAGKVCGIATYLERRALRFADNSYTLDPSSVLKFGVSVEAFASLVQKPGSTRLKLSDIAGLEKQATSAHVAVETLLVTNELLNDLGEGIGDLTVGNVRDPADSRRARSRSGRRGTTAVLGNTGPFVEAANEFRALGTLLNRYIPDSVRDEDVRQFGAHWRASMSAANDAINAVAATEGAAASRVSRISKAISDSLKTSRAEMARAVLAAEKIVTKYQPYMPTAEAALKKLKELKDQYKGTP